MEVLVLFVTSRKMWARLSRVLVVVLLAVLLAGVFLYVQNSGQPKTADAAPPLPAGGKASAPAPASATARPTGGAAVASSGAISPAPAGGQGMPVMLQPLPPILPGPGSKTTNAERASARTSVATPAPAPAAPKPPALPRPAAATPLSA